ncbi:hypothetical protein HMPREF1624_01251 [Sporothrix schenckii ATCC 58251]|uniref:Glutamine synthetase n=1 Tax=Sporothrix schenckii (strain ATCC 58251 / de Perez 2211183) TaxID=1391915 RepID=U7Q6Z2_SPOS1|nr:hypothetical protein HMPREF1624_01251 [Sporothrix schenckii ATCC 58251]
MAASAPGGQAGLPGALKPAVATEDQIRRVVQVIKTMPIIDNHAHPLLKPEAVGRHPLLSIVSEAHGDAIRASVTALSHHRAVQQLSGVLGCHATWDSVVAAIEERRGGDYNAWVAQCLEGLETILLDDGLDSEDDAYEHTWHSKFTPTKCRRIVRIEAVAADIINRHCVAFDNGQPLDNVFDNMLEEFDTQIKQAISDPDVVGFKSVICYRTGLAMPRVVDIAGARESFSEIVTTHSTSGKRFRRLQHAGLNDLFVHRTAIHIRSSPGRFNKPIQFHTGLGDNDITLTKSSPAHLQDFIRTYSTVPIVLLHSGYPYVRDTGYLATVYSNVYADIGEVFPIVARHGQESMLREILELCPWSKVMLSTDGHWFPETYLLAILQARDVLETVVCDLVRSGQIGWQAAVQLVQDILFRNANKVYQLGLEVPGAVAEADEAIREAKGEVGKVPAPSDLTIWDAFTRGKAAPDFVRVSWLDYTSLPRMRMIPFRRFDRLVRSNSSLDIGITKACLGLLQNDTAAPGVTPTGEYRLHPDFSSLTVGPMDGHINVNGVFREKDGSRVPLCPRSQLIRAIKLSAGVGISHLVGFEVEFVLLQRTESHTPGQRFAMLSNDGHAWSASRFYNNPAVARLIRDIVQDLDAAGVEVEQIHAESAPGQFELILPAKPPLEAVDSLLLAREAIAHRATKAGYKFTLHPKPYANACGTASHMHLSLVTPDGRGNDKNLYGKFYAGILEHLQAIAAFTYSSPSSYERVVDSAWAGGRWVTWGTQNRETPLRKIEDSHWELKCVDGLANPYLALTAVLLAGLSGVVNNQELTWADCTVDPATLTPTERTDLGITSMLPADVSSALQALQKDETFVHLIGPDVVEHYVTVKTAETALYFSRPPMDSIRREFIIERY